MTQSNENPQKIFSEIKSALNEGVADRNHGFHTPVFSNIDRKNSISSKIVVLRNFDQKKKKIFFHTDFRSKKIKNLTFNSKTNFLFYDPIKKIQLRISTISYINHFNNITLSAWKKTKLSSKKCYLAIKAPSSNSKLPSDSLPKHLSGVDPTEDEAKLGYKNFAVIENKIISIDWLHLSHRGHRRLLIDTSKRKISYQWLVP